MMIIKDIIGRNFKFYGTRDGKTYYIDVDFNVYSLNNKRGTISFTGTVTKDLPFGVAMARGALSEIFPIHDWTPGIFKNYA